MLYAQRSTVVSLKLYVIRTSATLQERSPTRRIADSVFYSTIHYPLQEHRRVVADHGMSAPGLF